MPTVRRATIKDIPAITGIYNDAVLTTTGTFDTTPKTYEQQVEWFNHHGEKHPVFVAENEAGEVVGWASISEWSDRCAYEETGQVSIYVAASARGQGIGKQLMQALDHAAIEIGYHTMLAGISEGNEVSFKLHESLGFKTVGILKEVGFKFGQRLDVHWLQKVYK